MSNLKVFVQNEYDVKFQRFLLEILEKKKKTNPRFSLRAFSRLVEIDQSLLSKILKGKKSIGAATMLRVLQSLGANEEEVLVLLSQLEATGLIKKSGEEFHLLGGNNTWASISPVSEAKVQFQRSILEESLRSLDAVPFQYRDHSSVLFTINKSDVNAYREIIKEIRRRLADLFMKSKDHDEVFVLSMSLFPVTFKE